MGEQILVCFRTTARGDIMNQPTCLQTLISS